MEKKLKNAIIMNRLTKIMFVLGFLLTSVWSYSSNSVYAQNQKFSFEFKQTSIKTIFQYIEKHSEFIFMYRTDLLDTSKKVSVKVEKQSIEQILEQVLKGTSVVYEINDRQIVLKKGLERLEEVPQQSRQKKLIQGLVKDDRGEVIIGATIKVKGTTIGTTTNMDGLYNLSVPSENSILIVSYIGYATQEIKVGNRQNIIITLQFSLIRHVIEENLEKRYFRDLEYRLLNGSLSNDEENEVAGMHGLNDAEIYRVVTFRMDAKKNMEKFTNAQIKETEMVENEIIRYLPRKHIFLQTNQIVYIHRETEQENGLEFRKKLEKLQQTIQEFLVNRGVEKDFLIGIGKTVTGYHELKESFKSSKIALKYIKVIRRMIGDESKSVIDSTKIGFFYHVIEKMKDIISCKRLYQSH